MMPPDHYWRANHRHNKSIDTSYLRRTLARAVRAVEF